MPFGAIFGGLDLGIGSAIGGGLAAAGLDFIPAGLVTGALEGAGGGAALSGITGGDPGIGALTGALTGGTLGSGLGGALGDATGIGTTAGDALVGGASGALGSAVTGGNVGLGAAGGVGAGLLTGGTGGSGSAGAATTASPAAGPGAGSGASALGAPAALASAGTDLTSGGISDLVASTANNPISVQPLANTDAVSAAPISGAPGTATPSAGTDSLSSDQWIASQNATQFPSTGPWTTEQLFNPANPNTLGVAPDTFHAAGFSNADITAAGANPQSSFGNKALDFAGNHWQLLAGAGLLGGEALFGNQPLPAQGQLQSQIGQNSSAAAALQSYETTGKLPPGLQSVVNASTNANEAAIRSNFARMGLSGSSSEAQALAGAKTQAAGQISKIATDLFSQGVSLSQLSAQELAQLLQSETQQSEDFMKSLSTFATGLAGGFSHSTSTPTG